MSAESSIPERSEEQFSQAFGDMFEYLADQVKDPHVEYVHDSARNAANYMNAHPEEASALLIGLVNLIDERWRYVDEKLEVTAPVWIIDPQTHGLTMCAQLINERVTSRGFTIMRKGLGDDPENLEQLDFEAAHYVRLQPADNWPNGAHGVIFLDDITHLGLPYPSEEMRAKNLRYTRPDIVATIDTIAGQSGRPDQMLKEFKRLTIRLDTTIQDNEELMLDVAAYLNMYVVLEKGVTYRMEVQGDVIRVDDDGDMFTESNDQPRRMVTKVRSIAILPEISALGLSDPGERVHQVYLHVDALSDEVGRDEDFVIPCSSLNWVSSSRYDQDLPPTYVEETSNE